LQLGFAHLVQTIIVCAFSNKQCGLLQDTEWSLGRSKRIADVIAALYITENTHTAVLSMHCTAVSKGSSFGFNLTTTLHVDRTIADYTAEQ
jgi:hypothetical protein